MRIHTDWANKSSALASLKLGAAWVRRYSNRKDYLGHIASGWHRVALLCGMLLPLSRERKISFRDPSKAVPKHGRNVVKVLGGGVWRRLRVVVTTVLRIPLGAELRQARFRGRERHKGRNGDTQIVKNPIDDKMVGLRWGDKWLTAG